MSPSLNPGLANSTEGTSVKCGRSFLKKHIQSQGEWRNEMELWQSHPMLGQTWEKGLNREVREAVDSLGILNLSSSGLGDSGMQPLKNDLPIYFMKIRTLLTGPPVAMMNFNIFCAKATVSQWME